MKEDKTTKSFCHLSGSYTFDLSVSPGLNIIFFSRPVPLLGSADGSAWYAGSKELANSVLLTVASMQVSSSEIIELRAHS